MASDIFAELTWRGLIHQTTDERLPEWLNTGQRTVYAGFDPTADSLHVGHLMPLLILRRFQGAGHRPIALLGGATGMIGDPSGKSEERSLLSLEALQHNVASIEKQVRRFLDFDSGGNGAVLVNNYDWMHRFSYLEYLRDIGKNFPVNVMLAKDSVKNRLQRTDSGLSYTEFSYMLLQAYDFVYLHEHFGCELQLGGSDQWGNITAGIDLGRRMRNAQFFGITCPLLLDREGKKIGKTEAGTNVWLSADRMSPYAFYQYWMQMDDADVGMCLRFLTELPRSEVEELDEARQSAPHERASQKRLAQELTHMVHGAEGVQTAERATEIFFGGEIHDISEPQLLDIFADVPSKQVPRQRLEQQQLTVVDALVESGLCTSKGEARRTIQQGGAYIRNRRCSDVDKKLTAGDLASRSVMVLRKGKNKYALLQFID